METLLNIDNILNIYFLIPMVSIGIAVVIIGLILLFFAPEIGMVLLGVGAMLYFAGPLIIGVFAIIAIAYVALNSA